jgi:hypothetical protein
MLEALLARIKANAAAPRITHEVAAAAAPPEVSEEPVVEEKLAPEVEAPLESRARLVAAPRADMEAEEIEAEDVLELDDRHVVREETPAPAPAIDAFAATTEMNIKNLELPPPQEPDEAPPPSSRRPIAEPAETPQEAQIAVTHTPPPESGKQVAAEALSFDDDQTGVREAQPPRIVAPPPAEPSIQLQSLRSPPTAQPAPPDELEAELTSEATAPPPGPLPELRAPRVESAPEPVVAEVTRPTRPVAAANIAEMAGTVKPVSPKTFGELLDLTLGL